MYFGMFQELMRAGLATYFYVGWQLNLSASVFDRELLARPRTTALRTRLVKESAKIPSTPGRSCTRL